MHSSSTQHTPPRHPPQDFHLCDAAPPDRPRVPPQTVLCVVGTRPEAIKMAPVIGALAASDWARPLVLATGQQQDLLDQALADFGVRVDLRLPHTTASHTPAGFLAHCVQALDGQIVQLNPAAVVAQGDTTTVHAAAMAAFYRRLPFVHVEAGLRTGDLNAPFPEEYHRRAIALATTLHCAPTAGAAAALRAEGVPDAQIVQTGNTVIDALLATAARRPALPDGFPQAGRTVLLTLHRRENFGANIRNALAAVREFADAHEDVSVWFPVHPNPQARDAARAALSGHPRVRLVDPMGYRPLVAVLSACWCVLTDSGGLQEEAPALGRPVLVLRDRTERPEAVEAGVARLVGTSRTGVLAALESLYRDTALHARMARGALPYGDGHAAVRIEQAMRQRLLAAQPALHAGQVLA